MFHFPGFAPSRLCIQRAVRRHYTPGVSPFGHPRFIAWLAAPRGFSQPPTSFFASDCLGIHRVPFVAWSLPPLFVLAAVESEAKPLLRFFLSLLLSKITNPPDFSEVQLFRVLWWSRSGSNRRHPACKAGALPAELRPRCLHGALVGLERFELSTPRLSSVCSNQLSYRPSRPAPDAYLLQRPLRSFKTKQRVSTLRADLRTDSFPEGPKWFFLRKEVIQPQVPLRLPCYDFTPVADPTVVGGLLAVSQPA